MLLQYLLLIKTNLVLPSLKYATLLMVEMMVMVASMLNKLEVGTEGSRL